MDDRLRALDRRFRETGAVADEAAWLGERVRAGRLTRDRLVVAAWCDHPAAIALVGRRSALPPWWSAHARQWLDGVDVDFHSPRPADPFASLAADTLLALAALDAACALAGDRPWRTPEEAELRGRLRAWALAGAAPADLPPGRPFASTSPHHAPTDQLLAGLGYAQRFDDPDPPRAAQAEWDSYRARWSATLEWLEGLAPPADLRAAARAAIVAWTLSPSS